MEGNQFFWCVRCYNRITLYVTPDLPPALIFCVVRRSTQLGNELCGSCLPHLSIETSAIRHKLIPVSYARQPVWGYPKHRAIIINGSRRLDIPPPLESQHAYIYWMLRTPSAVSSLSLSIVTCRLVFCISLIIIIHCLSITIQF